MTFLSVPVWYWFLHIYLIFINAFVWFWFIHTYMTYQCAYVILILIYIYIWSFSMFPCDFDVYIWDSNPGLHILYLNSNHDYWILISDDIYIYIWISIMTIEFNLNWNMYMTMFMFDFHSSSYICIHDHVFVLGFDSSPYTRPYIIVFPSEFNPNAYSCVCG